MTDRRFVSRGRPSGDAGGSNGLINAHSASVKRTCVTQSVAAILAPSDFSPSHRASLESRKSEGITTS
jgi:hypothetical protein